MSNNSFFSSFNLGLVSNQISVNIRLNKKNIYICKSLYVNNLISSYHFNFNSNKITLFFYNSFDRNQAFKIKQVSTPGRKVFIKISRLKHLKLHNSYFCILSTNKGIITSTQAISYGIGGELLFLLKC